MYMSGFLSNDEHICTHICTHIIQSRRDVVHAKRERSHAIVGKVKVACWRAVQFIQCSVADDNASACKRACSTHQHAECRE